MASALASLPTRTRVRRKGQGGPRDTGASNALCPAPQEGTKLGYPWFSSESTSSPPHHMPAVSMAQASSQGFSAGPGENRFPFYRMEKQGLKRQSELWRVTEPNGGAAWLGGSPTPTSPTKSPPHMLCTHSILPPHTHSHMLSHTFTHHTCSITHAHTPSHVDSRVHTCNVT